MGDLLPAPALLIESIKALFPQLRSIATWHRHTLITSVRATCASHTNFSLGFWSKLNKFSFPAERDHAPETHTRDING